MKRNLKTIIVTVTCACASLTALTLNAAEDTGYYVRPDIGGTWTPETELKEFFGSSGGGRKVKFDPGARFGISGGYKFCDWFSAEAQTGIMISSLDTISGANRVDATFSNVPFLLNGRLQLPTHSRFTPYIGGGAGMSLATLDADPISLNGRTLNGSDVDVVFAYQGFAGVRYELNDRMGLALEYHYFGTTEPAWDARHASGHLKFGGIETHALTVAFDYKF
jgi:opacity protein-like surface antigen